MRANNFPGFVPTSLVLVLVFVSHSKVYCSISSFVKTGACKPQGIVNKFFNHIVNARVDICSEYFTLVDGCNHIFCPSLPTTKSSTLDVRFYVMVHTKRSQNLITHRIASWSLISTFRGIYGNLTKVTGSVLQ